MKWKKTILKANIPINSKIVIDAKNLLTSISIFS